MPMYEYSCAECGKAFEELVPLRERHSKRVCPNCGSRKVERLVSVFAMGKPSADTTTSVASCPTCSTGVCDLD